MKNKFKPVPRDPAKCSIVIDEENVAWVVESTPEDGVVSRSFAVRDPEGDSRITDEERKEIIKLLG